MRDWTIDRGRPTEFDKTDTGTAVVRLVDREGLFDPTNGTSPYNGKVLPGKQAAIALQNPVSDTWFTMFRGFVESWYYRLDQTRQYMELELQLVDGFAILVPRRAAGRGGRRAAAAGGDRDRANVGYGYTEGTVKDRIDGILDDVRWPAALDGHVHRQRPGRPESLRARHQRVGRDLGCGRRRVPWCRELLDEQRRPVHVPGPAGPVPARGGRVQHQQADGG